MYDLIQLTEHDYYIDCPARIGLIRLNGTDVALIDSGGDRDAGKKVHRLLASRGWALKAIYNTHAHADHIGGNRFLQEQSGCRIYARGMERVHACAPELEPIGLYGGPPLKELRHKFFLAQESAVEELTEDALPECLTMLDLSGHSFAMAGFLTKEGTAYIADCVSSEETLSKYGITYLWDPEAALHTLASIQALGARRFVPAHAPVTEDIRPLAALNATAITEVKRRILGLCAAPISFETLLKRLFDAYALQMTAPQYALVGSTLRSYLSSMRDQNAITCRFQDNEMLWERVSGPREG